MIIGLTGTKASGKGVVADMLKEKGFEYSSMSDRVREEAVDRNLEDYTVKDLQDIGDDLRKKFGLGVLAIRTLERLKDKNNCVIDGIRNLGEIEELRKNPDFVLIGVDAPSQIRFKRLIERGRFSDPKDYQDFLVMDQKDKGIESDSSGQQVSKCLEEADFLIMNDDTFDVLRNKINKIFGELNI